MSAGLGPIPVSTRTVRPSVRTGRTQVKAHVLLSSEVPGILVPVLLRNSREKVAEIELEGAIRQRHDFLTLPTESFDLPSFLSHSGLSLPCDAAFYHKACRQR